MPDKEEPSRTNSMATTRPSSRSRKGEVTAGSWCWVCPGCLVETQQRILGKRVKVWWGGDSKYYEGWIESFDDISEEHRINYSDGEWEFLSIKTEDFLILIDEDDLSLMRAPHSAPRSLSKRKNCR